MLYRVTAQAAPHTYTYLRTIQLAGSSGPLRQHHDVSNPHAITPMPWHATEADILRYVVGSGPDCAILIDLKPRQQGNISLYRLRDIWGFSYDWWTPLALHLESLFVDKNAEDPAVFKQEFTDHDALHEHIGEFLYLQGGTRGATWNWGMVGRVNGALLWEDAFRYLVPELAKVIAPSASGAV